MSKPNVDDISEKFKKLDQRTHLLQRPGMYIGSVYDTIAECWVVEHNPTVNKTSDSDQDVVSISKVSEPVMVKKNLKYNPGILKLFDEITMNALDQSREHPNEVTEIRITIDIVKGMISVFNNGPGIPIVIHKEHKVYIPELIFSQFLTSTNYNDNEKRIKAGLNGLGAKITSTFSTFFQIETVNNGMIYQQNFTDNLSVIEKPLIEKTKKKDYTKITFFPDLKRFKIPSIGESNFKVLEKRSYDLAASTGKNVKVFFNEEKLKVTSFIDYIDMFLPEASRKEKVVVETERWSVAICSSPNEEFNQVSFVNGVNTMAGGTHVNYIINPVIKKIIEKFQKKAKDTVIKPNFLKDNMFVFVFALIENPEFNSQAKEELTTKPPKFGSKFEISDAIIAKIEKMDMIKRMMQLVKFKESAALSATDGKKRLKIFDVEKLKDAQAAGGKNSQQCTLILTEGDSAKTFAISGLPVHLIEYYGVYPLRGKFLNVRKASDTQINKSQVIIDLKNILGLQNGKKFKTLDDLKKTMRYGKIMIISDQDCDGFHIKGLLINFFHFFWPQLVQDDTFITCLKTPLIKAFKGNNTEVFYSMPEYLQWKNQSTHINWKIKYYKGLGTSTSAEAKECFKNFEQKIMVYTAKNKEDNEHIDLAFNGDDADDRKVWIKEHTGKEIYLKASCKNVPVKQYVNEELVLFSIEDCIRSIPNMMDGFKPSQRKVFYGMIKKNTMEEIKVNTLSGYLIEHTAYHHGDASLNQTIISMNHNFVGSNNINVLFPEGQLGSRLEGGEDAAQPRYIATRMNSISKTIFSSNDSGLLEYLNDDGHLIEPKMYYPAIPMILVNGSAGIGTGYACNIPSYNPMEIIKHLKGLIVNINHPIPELVPWYRGFTGTVEKSKTGGWMSRGKWTRLDRNTVHITELPIGVWTNKYQSKIKSIIQKENSEINDIDDRSTELTVDFKVKVNPLTLNNWIEKEEVEKVLDLTNRIPSNLTLFDENGKIKVYDSVEQILYEFFGVRNKLYIKRWDYIKKDFDEQIIDISAKVLFIQNIIDNRIKVFRVPKSEIAEQLNTLGYPKKNGNYDYLLNIPIYSFTKEKLEKLESELYDVRMELDVHVKKKPTDLWLEDLSVIEKEFKKMI
jgi:DNA topoisomerase-2